MESLFLKIKKMLEDIVVFLKQVVLNQTDSSLKIPIKVDKSKGSKKR